LTKKELHHLCLANGVSPLLYKWTFSEWENECMKKKLTPALENIEEWIRARNILYINLKDSAIGSRIGVTFLKAAFIAGFIGSRFTNQENISGYQRENWYENGDVYTNLIKADFLVVDKVTNKLEPWQIKIWDKFVEERLLNDRSTVFVGVVRIGQSFDTRAIDLLKALQAKVLTDEGGIQNVKE
jgi:hypothetical protein